MEGENIYAISIYNIENKNISRMFEAKRDSMMGEFQKINFINSNKYLYICYQNSMDIFDLDNNHKLVHLRNNNDLYEYEKNNSSMFNK